MDKETSYRPALFGKDGQYLLRVRGIRLTPSSPEPWLAWPGLPALSRPEYKDKAVYWYIHREWNAALALPEVISKSGAGTLYLRRLMDSGQLVACGPVPDTQRQMLKQLVTKANTPDCRTINSIPAGLSTEEDFRTLTHMLVRDRFGQDPEATFYVSGRSGFDLSSVDSDVPWEQKDYELTDAPITDRTRARWRNAKQALQAEQVAEDRPRALGTAETTASQRLSAKGASRDAPQPPAPKRHRADYAARTIQVTIGESEAGAGASHAQPLQPPPDAAHNPVTRLQQEAARIQEEAARVQDMFTKQDQTIKDLTTDNETLRTTNQKLTHTVTQLTQEREATAHKDKTIHELREQVAAMQADRAQQEADNASLRQEVAELRAWKSNALKAASLISGFTS